MKFILPLLILFSLSLNAKNLNIIECLELIEFQPERFSSGDFSFEGLEPFVDLKNGYYEITDPDPNRDITYIQAAKFNNNDGSITLMITGYYYDMVCESYKTEAFLIIPDENTFVEMSLYDLNLDLDIMDFQGNSSLKSTMEKLLEELQGQYLDEGAPLEQLYSELFDFHFILPQKGTAITVTLTICDYIPLNEIEINEEDWNTIESGLISYAFQYDKKFIRFEPSK